VCEYPKAFALLPESILLGSDQNLKIYIFSAYQLTRFPDLFLTRDILLLRYQMALVVESGSFETVLWQQVSHLLLKYTKIRLWNRINGGLCPSGL
jgi:hypothetical protein